MPSALFVWIVVCIAMAMIYTLFTAHPFRMKELGFEDPRLFSLTIMAATASSAFTGWNLKRLSKIVGPHLVFAITFFMFGAGFLVISYAQELWHIVIGNLLLGIGMGLPVPSGAAWLSRIAPGAVRGRGRSGAGGGQGPGAGYFQYFHIPGTVPLTAANPHDGILHSPCLSDLSDSGNDLFRSVGTLDRRRQASSPAAEDRTLRHLLIFSKAFRGWFPRPGAKRPYACA